MHRFTLFAIVCLVAASLMGAQAHATATPNPQAVNLTLNDMPTGFTPRSAVTRTNAQAALLDGRTVAAENKTGRVLSSEVQYEQRQQPGIMGVDSTVIEFDTAAHARAAYLSGYKSASASGTARQMKAAPVGSLHSAWTYTEKSGGFTAIDDLISFCRGRYLVHVTGLFATIDDPSQILSLARIVDTRIEHTQ